MNTVASCPIHPSCSALMNHMIRKRCSGISPTGSSTILSEISIRKTTGAGITTTIVTSTTGMQYLMYMNNGMKTLANQGLFNHYVEIRSKSGTSRLSWMDGPMLSEIQNFLIISASLSRFSNLARINRSSFQVIHGKY